MVWLLQSSNQKHCELGLLQATVAETLMDAQGHEFFLVFPLLELCIRVVVVPVPLSCLMM